MKDPSTNVADLYMSTNPVITATSLGAGAS